MEAISGKHSVEEISGIRCSVIDKLASTQRASFLKNILEYNGYTVLSEENARKPKDPEDAPLTFKVGVTDVTFMLPIALYFRKLKIPMGNKLADEIYWLQQLNSTK
ncbi:MAG: hypothetical protein HND27_08430 [Bacteroidetes bacterium]|nr:hypothetical protein [Bacteroidota bacterium]MBV6460370.1 hypothetical protein [Flavobacteriales bacterium]WKZ74738.1 MAG: hypothetical protein QY303_11375 [Vicingaceae bacterium]MCL4815762.1 hypothetical protein [Flavobacteriales bacterium]NOG95792.1 hypothetical protein [Bacteroidota bacterium]